MQPAHGAPHVYRGGAESPPGRTSTWESRSRACRCTGGSEESIGTLAARYSAMTSISAMDRSSADACAGSSMFCHASRRRTSSRRPSTAPRVTLSV
eukprot:scaffold2843_cov90-Isochrysis_galbana.AAC.5